MSTLSTARRIANDRWRALGVPQAVIDLDNGGELGERSIIAVPLDYCDGDEFAAFDGRVIEVIPDTTTGA